MTDYKDRDIHPLRDLHEHPRRLPHLRDTAGSRGYILIVHRLDRINDDDLRLNPCDCLPDRLKARLTQDQKQIGKCPHPLRSQTDLLQRLLS